MRQMTLEECYEFIPKYIATAVREEIEAGITEAEIVERVEEIISDFESRDWTPRMLAAIFGTYVVGCIRESVTVQDTGVKHDA